MSSELNEIFQNYCIIFAYIYSLDPIIAEIPLIRDQ